MWCLPDLRLLAAATYRDAAMAGMPARLVG